MPSYPEGTIADGPNGAIIYRGGQWVPMNSAPTVVQAPYNPATAYEAPKAAAGLQSTQVNTQGQVIDNRVAEATAPATIAQAMGSAEKQALEIEKLRRELAQGPQVTPQQAEMRDRLSRLEQLTGQIDRVQQLYDAGPGKTKGLSGALDYLPTDSNAAFDAAGAALSQQGLAAFRVPGTGTVSDRDAMMFDRANLPQSDTRDAAIEEQLRGLRARVNAEMTALGRTAPWDEAGKRIEQKDPLHATYLDAGDAPKQSAGFGADTKLVPIPAALQQEYNAYMANWTRNPDVGDYVKFRTALDQKYGYAGDAAKQEEHRSRAEEWQKGLMSRKGYTIPLGIGGAQQPMTGAETNANDLINALTIPMNATDSLALGAPSALLRKFAPSVGADFDANNENNWKQALTGQVIGAIGGTKGISLAGRGLSSQLGRAGEVLRTGGGIQGNVARNIGADATYASGVGATQEGDPLGGAGLGAVGSLGGQGIGGAAGRLLRGVSAPSARRLTEAGITLTPGQIARSRGGIVGNSIGGIEDRLAGFPVVGEMIGAARQAGVEDFGRIDMQDAIAGIPGNVTRAGNAGFAQADGAVGRAYDDALNPMSLSVDDDLTQALARYGEYAPAVNNQVSEGALSGQGFQAAKQILDQELANLRMTPGGFNNIPKVQGLRDAMFEAGERQAPDLMAKYNAADDAFASLVPIRKAVAGATNQGGVYTPAQKGTSFRTTDRSSGKRATALGNRPGYDWQQAAQQILPSHIPDSGTAGRMMLGGTVLGAGAAGEQGWIDPSTALAVGGTAALYTKGGQKAIQNLLLKRTGKFGKQARAAGQSVKKMNKRGLFGAGTVPIVLEDQGY